jgi:hypothetical protein
MDEDEEAGLRAFALNVGAYAGSTNPERPLWIEIGDRRVEVAALDAQWREDERLGFRVRLSDGSRWLLYYVPELDLWSGTADASDGSASVTPRRQDGPRPAGS